MDAKPKIGSLFSGVAGLDRAVEQHFGAEVAWFVEYDAAPSKVLAHHYPGVPNYGDVSAVDWANVEPVDILTGGFPCQDVSLAGARKGLKDGTRSGLWSEYAKAIDILRPSLVVIENVRGLLSASTVEEIDAQDSELEWFEGSVGELGRGNRPVLNAFGRVLGDLAELGYDAEWCGLRAADAGAPHNRFRVFVVANPVGERWREGRAESARGEGGSAAVFRGSDDLAENADLAARNQRGEPAPGQAESGRSRADAVRRGRAPTPDTDRDSGERRGGHGDVACASGASESPRDQRERDGDATDDRGSAATDTDSAGCVEHGRAVTVQPEHEAAEHGSSVDWGAYAPAIERWEAVIGRPALSPTNPDGRNGQHRLAAQFTEWMMGWPAGWVTDPAIGLTRNEQLKACGNGVVTAQALLALQVLA